MRYMPTLAFQIISFVYSAGLGFVLGIAYDFIRILFYFFTWSDKKLSVCRDIIYSFVCLATTFLFLLVMCEGKMFFYVFIGEGIGLFIYLYALSGVFILPIKRKIDKIKTFFIRIKTDFYTLCKKICKILNKRIKNSKKYLHIAHGLLYNFSVKLCSQNKKLKNRGDENGQSRKEET